jgi:electron transfer flavoprotein alpha subunit
MRRIAILAPQRAGVPTTIALELATAARDLAEEVEAFTFGSGSTEAARVLGEHGVARVLCIATDEDLLPAPGVAAAIAERLATSPVDALLLPSTYDGRDVAARLSARLDVPVLANAIGLAERDGDLLAEHAVFGGSELVSARIVGASPELLLVRPKSFEVGLPSGGVAEIIELACPDPGGTNRARVLSHHVESQEGPALDEARVVVSGGRGLGSKENYELIERLAELLGGAAGASRAVVDAGWAPYARQVGQTGKTVKPEVYLACGISGATQHLVGMKGARHIVAINRDADAPIFSIAELGVVGDLHQIVPKLITALEQEKG